MRFLNYGNSSIGRITTSGHVTNYTGTGMRHSLPAEIAAGPDGALWFANGYSGGSPRPGRSTIYNGIKQQVIGITAPDRAMWFTGGYWSQA